MAGFPNELFREPSIEERFLCCICLMVFRDAVQSPCGHRYCESCIMEKIKNESEKRCPSCPDDSSEGVIDEVYPDYVARKELRNASVKCINKGCNWLGKLREYSTEHEASCLFERIKCLKSGCGKTLKRGDLSHHLEKECPMRVIECRFCKKQLPYKESKKHTTECPDDPVTCNCGKRVARSQMEKHLNPVTGDCIVKTKCVFHPIGCIAKVAARGMKDHMSRNVVEHNRMIVEAINAGLPVKDKDGGACQQLDKGSGEFSKIKGYASLPETTPNVVVMRKELALKAEDQMETKMKKSDLQGSVDVAALQREITNKLKVDLEKSFSTKLEREWTEKIKNTNAMIAVLDHRTETYQQVLAVLSDELEALHTKYMKLEKQNTYLKEVTERQENRLQSKVVASGMEDHVNKNVEEPSQMVVEASGPSALAKGQDGEAQPLDKGLEEVIKIKGFASLPETALQDLVAMVKEQVLKSIDPTETKMKKRGPHGSVDVAALQSEIIEKLKADLEVILATMLEKELAENKDTNAMVTVLDRRIEINQEVLAVLSNQVEALHAKAMALEKQNTYLKEVTERQDQLLTLKNIALAEYKLRIQALEATSFDGVLLWRISEYECRRQDAVSGRTTSFYSPVFYTSRHGYKMAAKVYLNGEGMEENTLSLFFVVMPGLHDALLPWPFQQKVTFTLLDQNKRAHFTNTFYPTSSSFKKPSSDNIASSWSLSVTQELLNGSDSYVKDDTMFIKVVVDTTGLEKL